MVSDIYALKEFADENKLSDGAIINKEKLFSFLLVKTKHSPYTINTSLHFFITLRFLEKKSRLEYIFKKSKLDDFLKRDQ